MARTPPKGAVAGEAITIRPATITKFPLWIVGTMPLITHSWSDKAKREMLDKQKKRVTGGKGVRDPEADFQDSLYLMNEAEGIYGFPATGLKKAILTPAHKDRGVARSGVLTSLWIQSELVRVQPALGGAICDMPLVRIVSGKPEMREDMVRVGSGLNKSANLAYRAQFWPWAMRVIVKLNTDVVPPDAFYTLVEESGMSCGLGEWRNEKSGVFGSFKVARAEEAAAWDRFRLGEGPLPAPPADDDELLEAA